MAVHEFRLVLDVPPDVADDPAGEKAEDLSDRLYLAGCDDGSLGISCGDWDIIRHGEADSLAEAIRSAIEEVERVGCRVVRVESPDQYIFDRINEELTRRPQTALAMDH
jgi:hypothetical protein